MSPSSPLFCFLLGAAGFALIGYVHVHLAGGKRFRDQSSSRKRAIVCLALAQWPYLALGLLGLFGMARNIFG
jgi:hypothetical protein